MPRGLIKEAVFLSDIADLGEGMPPQITDWANQLTRQFTHSQRESERGRKREREREKKTLIHMTGGWKMEIPPTPYVDVGHRDVSRFPGGENGSCVCVCEAGVLTSRLCGSGPQAGAQAGSVLQTFFPVPECSESK